MIDVFATLVLLFVVTVQTYTLFDKVVSTYRDNVLTFDLDCRPGRFFWSPGSATCQRWC